MKIANDFTSPSLLFLLILHRICLLRHNMSSRKKNRLQFIKISFREEGANVAEHSLYSRPFNRHEHIFSISSGQIHFSNIEQNYLFKNYVMTNYRRYLTINFTQARRSVCIKYRIQIIATIQEYFFYS